MKSAYVVWIFLFACIGMFSQASESKSAQPRYSLGGHEFTYEVLTQLNDVIWGFDFLSDGRIILTERKGKIRILDPKTQKVTEVSGAPKVWARSQGGLLDIRVRPLPSGAKPTDPAQPTQIYLSYSEPFENNKSATAVGVAKLQGNSLVEFKRIFTSVEPINEGTHFGSRIEFDGKGHIFVTLGERGTREKVQELSNHFGKVVRLKEDGSIPEDNPFVKNKNAKSEIWALGLRSPQGLVMHSASGELWSADMGPRGGDELNIIKPGANYGWPTVTYGREYWGPKIGEGTSKKGIEEPVVYWVPSISPSGITIYEGDAFANWKGNIFVGNLSGQHIRRLVLKNSKVVSQEEMLKGPGMRFRNIRSGPDGYLYFSTDDGKVARIVPAK